MAKRKKSKLNYKEKMHNRLVVNVYQRLLTKGYDEIMTHYDYVRGEIDIWAFKDRQGERFHHIYEVKINPGKIEKATQQLNRAQRYLEDVLGETNVKKTFVSVKHDGNFYARRIE